MTLAVALALFGVTTIISVSIAVGALLIANAVFDAVKQIQQWRGE